MKRYKWTIAGFVLMLALWGCIVGFNLDLFESLTRILNRFEKYELNDLFLLILVFYTFAMADLWLRHESLRIETENLKIYNKMVEAMYQILNNFLQKMLGFKMAAEDTPGFDPEALKFYDQIIKETDQQIQELGSLEKVDEELIEQTITAPVKNQPAHRR